MLLHAIVSNFWTSMPPRVGSRLLGFDGFNLVPLHELTIFLSSLGILINLPVVKLILFSDVWINLEFLLVYNVVILLCKALTQLRLLPSLLLHFSGLVVVLMEVSILLLSSPVLFFHIYFVFLDVLLDHLCQFGLWLLIIFCLAGLSLSVVSWSFSSLRKLFRSKQWSWQWLGLLSVWLSIFIRFLVSLWLRCLGWEPLHVLDKGVHEILLMPFHIIVFIVEIALERWINLIHSTFIIFHARSFLIRRHARS